MAIDRIGKKPGMPGGIEAPERPGGVDDAGDVGETAATEATGKTFGETVDAVKGAREASNVSEVGGSEGPSPLNRLQSGEINVDQYVDAKLDEAMASPQMRGLDAGTRDMLRDELRARMTEESHLADLMQWVKPAS